MTVEEFIKSHNQNNIVYTVASKSVIACRIESFSLCCGYNGYGIGIDGCIKARSVDNPVETIIIDSEKDLFLTKKEAEAALEELLKCPSKGVYIKAHYNIAEAAMYLSGYKDEKSKDIARRLKAIEKEIHTLY